LKSILICHEDEVLNQVAMARWLGSFTDLCGIVSIRETRNQKKNRVKREIKRLGGIRFIDVILFRIYYKIFLSRQDATAEKKLIEKILAQYPAGKTNPEILVTTTPNSREAQEFIESLAPDIMIARCKVILKPQIFEAAKMGTFVMHPGICPEYRNAHGCFWALMKRDLNRVGMTLLKVDRGIDTGAIYGHFSYAFNEEKESHIEIQNRAVFENLENIKQIFLEISANKRATISQLGRGSKNWGQPWMSEYLRWKKRVKQKHNNGEYSGALLYHDVTNDAAASGFEGKDADLYKLSIKTFEDHLAAIAQNYPTVSTPSDLLSTRPDDTIIFTFDDGGVSAYIHTAPMLEARGFRGVFFIVTEKIGTNGFLNSEQILDLHQRGHVIGSHSHSHPMRFASLPNSRIFDEWKTSKNILEKIIGTKVLTASVPGGFYSKNVARLAQAAGFQIIYNSEPQARAYYEDKILVVGRFGIQMHTTTSEVLALAFNQGTLRLRQLSFWNFKKILKKIGGPVWITFRKWFLN